MPGEDCQVSCVSETQSSNCAAEVPFAFKFKGMVIEPETLASGA